ncbi:probable 18S rRNA (guanine-N(7))-methyltransferase [Manis pentadactyla]|uniref:probable 18S rRNA (guanine-N(7))-methyltransferase n=1 Tax=Manis pentadactyla TaxID=143292 RepID=UPI0018766EEC|nr:probable 18S rRNA (guanine-N(7))-methyltransferase [Manis pentadactyla]KAI5139909.1 putative 18S Rrna (Guanine-N(7))-Methyltransferase [Manis pentadactyla]
MATRVRRPEHGGPPEVFYDEKEARKYMHNSRMIEVQTRMAGRALELLCLPEGQPCYLLDIGCGSGLSGDCLSCEGHYWVGVDISPAMLDAALDREMEGDLLLGDMGQGLPFKPGTFDGCISISALQWLCNANKKSDIPAKRLYYFFSSLYSVLVRGARAVLQLYPENSEQLELITIQAMKAGFTGGVVVDYPNSAKAKKFYLCLFSGPSTVMPLGLNGNSDEEEEATESVFLNERIPHSIGKHRVMWRKRREWVLEKKARYRRQGKAVRPDTQYTGRKRRPRF